MEKKVQEETLLLLQLSDSAFPIGGFSHSLGLEAFVQHEKNLNKSQRTDKAKLVKAFVCILENTGSLAIPFVRASHGAEGKKEELCRLDKYLEANSTNHIAQRASTRQGKSLADTALFIYESLSDEIKTTLQALPHKHLAVVFGAVTSALGLDSNLVITAFMFSVVRTLIATAVRLDVIGALEGQKIQVHLQRLIPDVIQRNIDRGINVVAVKFPLVDVLQNTQDTLFCKLFYS